VIQDSDSFIGVMFKFFFWFLMPKLVREDL